MKIKSILLYSMFIAGTAFFVSSCDGNRTTDSRDVAERENAANLTADNRTGDNMTGDNRTGDNRTAYVIDNDNDAQFMMDAAEMQHKEIRLGKLAHERGNSAHVKELGKMMHEDHSKALRELQTLAQSKSITLPNADSDDSMDGFKNLNDKRGNDFDKAYTDMMVDHHEDAIDLYEKAAEDSEDPQVKSWATEKLPGLKTHLRHAKESKDKSDNTKS